MGAIRNIRHATRWEDHTGHIQGSIAKYAIALHRICLPWIGKCGFGCVLHGGAVATGHYDVRVQIAWPEDVLLMGNKKVAVYLQWQ